MAIEVVHGMKIDVNTEQKGKTEMYVCVYANSEWEDAMRERASRR